MAKTKLGRKTVMTQEVLGKLYCAFAIGCNDREACHYADINPDTLYSYQKKHPEFSERKSYFKVKPILMARKTVCDAISTDIRAAKWYLERKCPKEFSLKYISTSEVFTGEIDEEHLKIAKKLLRGLEDLDD